MQAYALALTVSILALALGAAVTASERDENVACLLGRGLVSRLSLLAAKIALATIISLAVGSVILLAFGIIVDVGGIAGGQPWQRVPLVLVGVTLFGAALGGLAWTLGRWPACVALVVAMLLLMASIVYFAWARGVPGAPAVAPIEPP